MSIERWLRSEIRKVSFLLLVLGAILCSQPVGIYAFDIPVPVVEKSVNKTSIYAGQTFRVTINVTGAEKEQDDRVPTAVVFALDESGSMADDDKFEFSRAAAIAVAELMIPGADKAALITFNSAATVDVPLTTVIGDVIDAIDALPSPGGSTNMADAFDAALNELAGDTTPNKMIIIFTDGGPSPNTGYQIGLMLGPLKDEAIVGGVRVFPVTLVDEFWLEEIADDTFGTYTYTADVTALPPIFETVFDEVSDILITQNLVITEVLAPEFVYIPNTLNYSFSGLSEPPDFVVAVQAAEDDFAATNIMTFPVIPILPGGRIFTFSFQATSPDCLTPFSPVEEVTLDIEAPTSRVQYTTGGDDIHTVYIPQEQIICKRPGDLILEKEFDEINLIVRITLTNAYDDRSLTDIEIFETLTFDFEPLLHTANPHLDAAPITRTTTPHRRWLYWHIDELAPRESREFSFEVRVLACTPDKSPPLDVNLVITPSMIVDIPPCARPHINYVVPTGVEPPFVLESRTISHLEDPSFIIKTSSVFELPPCPTEPGSLEGTIGHEEGSGCPKVMTYEDYTNIFTFELARGLNMISLPLKPITTFTARSFAEYVGSTVVIKIDEKRQKFVGFTLANPSDGFPIEGGKGYIINMKEDKRIAFVGAAWTNQPPVEAAPPFVSKDSAWAFIVSGPINNWAGRPCVATVKNLRTGECVTDYVKEDGYFSAVFADLTRRSVVQKGDEVEIALMDLKGQVIAGPIQKRITREDIHQAFAKLSLTIGEVIPQKTVLLQNYPNPFNPETWIPYQLAKGGDVMIRIYNVKGQLVKTLDFGYQLAGTYTQRARAAYWDGLNSAGEKAASGIYFYQIKAGDFSAMRKMVIVK